MPVGICCVGKGAGLSNKGKCATSRLVKYSFKNAV